MKPRPKKPDIPFEARLEQEASRLKQVASQLPHGTERDTLLRTSRQIALASVANEGPAEAGLLFPGVYLPEF